jgi:hypothetical protein
MPGTVLVKVKQELWRRYGSEAFPAEWDGTVYGGGKVSQRFWEYFKALELLDLRPDSVVLDLGGGSPITGLGFFMDIVALQVRRVIIMDPEVAKARNDNPAVTLIPLNATRETLPDVLRANPDITHISSISVLEHIPAAIRLGIFEAIDEGFKGNTVVFTCEYHPKRVFFQDQLTTRTLGEMIKPLASFYLDALEASPMHCEDALDDVNTLVSRRRKVWSPHVRFRELYVPRWYPIALRFRRADWG